MKHSRFASIVLLATLWCAGSARAQGGHCPQPSPDVEPNGSLATASPINRPPFLNSTIFTPSNGTIAPAGDVDHFRVSMTAGERLWLLVDTGVPATGTRDSRVRLLDSTGGVLAQNDDGGTGLGPGLPPPVVTVDASAIAGFAVPATGDYYVEVTAESPSALMSYRLLTGVTDNVSLSEHEPNDTPGQAQNPGVTGGHVLGQITLGDVDWYSAEVLDNGSPFVLVDGAVLLPAEDTALAFDSGLLSGLVIDSSGFFDGAVEAAMVPAITNIRVSGSTSPSTQGFYRIGIFYLGDTCQLPVTLQSFAVE